MQARFKANPTISLHSGGAFDIPGAARPAEFAGNNFLREFEQHEGVSDQYQHFDNIFEQGRQRGAPPGPGFRPPDRHETQLIEPCLQVGIGVFDSPSKHACFIVVSAINTHHLACVSHWVSCWHKRSDYPRGLLCQQKPDAAAVLPTSVLLHCSLCNMAEHWLATCSVQSKPMQCMS